MRYVNNPVIEERVSQPYVGIKTQISTDIARAASFGEQLLKWLHAHKEVPAGPPFLRYWYLEKNGQWQIEVGIPTSRLLEEDHQVITGYLPEGDYAHITHYGPPEELWGSSRWLMKWIEDEGLSADLRYEGEYEIWNGHFGFFVTEPFTETMPEAWKIGLYILLLGDNAA